jgi:hypothetical protein
LRVFGKKQTAIITMRTVAYREKWSSSSSRRSALVFVILLCRCFVGEANDVRARGTTADDEITTGENPDTSTITSVSSSAITTETTIATTTQLEDLWARETAAAQAELHRFLNGQFKFDAAFSMPGKDKQPSSTHKSDKTPPQSPSPPVAAPPGGPTATFTPQTARPTPLNGSCLTGRTPEQYLLDEMLLVSSVNLLLNPDFPQGMAFNFILADDTIRQDICAYPTLAQRYGLGTHALEFGDRDDVLSHTIRVIFPCFVQQRSTTPPREVTGGTKRTGSPPRTNVPGLASSALRDEFLLSNSVSKEHSLHADTPSLFVFSHIVGIIIIVSFHYR